MKMLSGADRFALPLRVAANCIWKRAASPIGQIGRFARVLVAVGAIGLTGCIETSGGTPPEIPRTTPFPADLQKDLLDAAFANVIVENCRGNLRVNGAAVGALQGRVEAESRRRGMRSASKGEMFALIGGEQALQDRVFGYVQKRSILISQPSSWCAAGNRELAEKTAISRYLL
jgi:hypothetical protein